jgi:hypothetical protein
LVCVGRGFLRCVFPLFFPTSRTDFLFFRLEGLGLNSSIILSAIGYGTVTTGTKAAIRYHTAYNLSVGNMIIVVAGLIPGFWASFLLCVPLSLAGTVAAAVVVLRLSSLIRTDFLPFPSFQDRQVGSQAYSAHGLHRPHHHALLHGLRVPQAQGQRRRRLRLPLLPQCVLFPFFPSLSRRLSTNRFFTHSQLLPELRPQHYHLRHPWRGLPDSLPFHRSRYLCWIRQARCDHCPDRTSRSLPLSAHTITRLVLDLIAEQD